MRFAAVFALVVGAAATPGWACPPHADFAFAVVSDGDAPGLAAAIDRLGFGGWPGDSVGLVVTGATIAEPLAPLVTISGDRLQGQPATGDVAYAADMAFDYVEGTRFHLHAMYVIGQMSPDARDRLHARARALHVHLAEYDTADQVARPRPRCEAQLVLPDPRPQPRAPSSPSKWPAVALLVAAAYLSRRALRV
ncbi:MAG: hypothetical protein ACM31C_29650 [Acidobacteriota bacterium]